MFSKEDFELPLEAELRLRVIKDEIDGTNDINALKEHLKETSRLIMFYQNLLGKVAKDILAKDMVDWIKENSKQDKDS
tara:strand:- start:225 stop:458 length:234 start_codon:yes stop_codon:yes gene_type:complete